MKILANDGIAKSGIDAMENAGFKVITDKVDQSQLIDYINKNLEFIQPQHLKK